MSKPSKEERELFLALDSKIARAGTAGEITEAQAQQLRAALWAIHTEEQLSLEAWLSSIKGLVSEEAREGLPPEGWTPSALEALVLWANRYWNIKAGKAKEHVLVS